MPTTKIAPTVASTLTPPEGTIGQPALPVELTVATTAVPVPPTRDPQPTMLRLLDGAYLKRADQVG